MSLRLERAPRSMVLCLAIVAHAALWGCGSGSPDEPLPAATAAASTSASAAAPPQRVRVKGISMDVPAAFVPLEAPRQERLRAAALARDPRSTVAVDARRAPGGMSAGTGYVLRIELPKDPAILAGTVRDVLRRAEAELRLEMKLQGASETQWDATYTADRLDVLSRATMTQGGKSAVLEMRTVAFVSSDDRIVTLGAQCLAESSTFCEPLLRSAVVEDEPRRGFDALLGPPQPRITSVAGFELGQRREDFVAACKRAKLRVDRFDWKKEPPLTREHVERGLLARCEGAPLPWEGGTVAAIDGSFSSDRLTRLSVGSVDDTHTVRTRLGEKHASHFSLPDGSLYVVDALAESETLYALEIVPFDYELPSKARVRTLVTYVTRDEFEGRGR